MRFAGGVEPHVVIEGGDGRGWSRSCLCLYRTRQIRAACVFAIKSRWCGSSRTIELGVSWPVIGQRARSLAGSQVHHANLFRSREVSRTFFLPSLVMAMASECVPGRSKSPASLNALGVDDVDLVRVGVLHGRFHSRRNSFLSTGL